MPSRHIPPQAFDAILSELGNDPAIPDPHGIRKSTAPPPSPIENIAAVTQPHLDFSRASPFLIFVGLILVLGAILFWALHAYEPRNEAPLTAIQTQIEALKNEFIRLEDQIHSTEENLYEEIDKIEVSIHSYKDKAPKSSVLNASKQPLGEAKLKQWQYLGLSKIGDIQHAFFNTDKNKVMLAQGDIAIGEWRLTEIEKDRARFSHPQGGLFFLETARGK